MLTHKRNRIATCPKNLSTEILSEKIDQYYQNHTTLKSTSKGKKRNERRNQPF